jgi:hypothetical protein
MPDQDPQLNRRLERKVNDVIERAEQLQLDLVHRVADLEARVLMLEQAADKARVASSGIG